MSCDSQVPFSGEYDKVLTRGLEENGCGGRKWRRKRNESHRATNGKRIFLHLFRRRWQFPWNNTIHTIVYGARARWDSKSHQYQSSRGIVARLLIWISHSVFGFRYKWWHLCICARPKSCAPSSVLAAKQNQHLRTMCPECGSFDDSILSWWMSRAPISKWYPIIRNHIAWPRTDRKMEISGIFKWLTVVRYRCAVHLDNFLSMVAVCGEEDEEQEADGKKKIHLSVSNASIDVVSIRRHVCVCNAIISSAHRMSQTLSSHSALLCTLTVGKPKNIATQRETLPCMFSASDTLITKSWQKSDAYTFKWLRGRENGQSPTTADERFHASQLPGVPWNGGTICHCQ